LSKLKSDCKGFFETFLFHQNQSMIAAIKRLRSSIRSAQRTLGGDGTPRCSGIRKRADLKKTGRRQAVSCYEKIGLIFEPA
jgi:hypothetical protein